MIEQVNAIDVIYDASKGIQNVVEFHTDYKEIKDRMESAYYELDDAFVNLKDLRDSLDFNPMVLEENETRLNSLKTLQRKYRKTVPELIDYLEEITRDLNNIEHYDDVIEQQLTKTKNCFQRLCNEAIILTDMRKKTAAYIEKELLKILKDLELPNTIFQVQFEDTNFTNELDSSIFFENGADKVEFMLSTNIGEPLKPLSSSASGGEMSRIMLGFKNLLAKSLGLSLMIFDEIDTGVSGYVANQVAKNMLEISKTTQVLCITHIPQVASISEHHLRLYKQVSNGRTTSHIVSLSGDERIEEIAKMISGDIVTEAGKSTAKELLSK
jgi:DNA repair protein RecN (Recombination protein N)